jgi:hypothetical protein
MNNYKIYDSSWSVIKMFASLEDAEAWRDANKPGLLIEDLGAAQQKTAEKLYKSDRAFLKQLFDNFNIKNRAQPQTPAEMVDLQQKFGNIALLADAGSINFVRASIAALEPPIGGVYTAQRQAEDLAEIDNYLSTRLYV